MNRRHFRFGTVVFSSIAALLFWIVPAEADSKADKTFTAVITDTQGVETELKNVCFYWEEKISETAFVPHELRQLPVKRGAGTVQVKFETIKQIEVKQSADKPLPVFAVTLTNGKNGEFTAALTGSFRGESDFGQTEIPISTITKIIFR